jgi:hypothetical protein
MMAASLAGATPQLSFRELSLTEMLSLSDWRRFVPETIGLLVALCFGSAVLPVLAGHGNAPHPFWVPVLLMSGQYGIMGGLFSAIAASAALYIDGLPPQSAAQDFYAYAGAVAAQPSAWFATALVLGGLRTLHIHHQGRLQDRLEQSQLAAGDLGDGLEHALQEIERLEQRIAADSCTLASLLHSFAKLDMRDAQALIGSMADVIRYGVGANSFAIYLNGPHGPEPCLGVQDGARLTTEAVPPLEPSLADALASGGIQAADPADGAGAGTDLIWHAIRVEGSLEPLGMVACSRLMPSRDRAIAERRLDEICRVLAVLLSACPDGLAAACTRTTNESILALEVC